MDNPTPFECFFNFLLYFNINSLIIIRFTSTCPIVFHYHKYILNLDSLILCFEWLRDSCSTPNDKFSNYTLTKTSYIQWHDNDARFVLNWMFIVIAHWNSPRGDTYLHPNTVFWFWAIPSLFLPIKVALLEEKGQIPML